MNSTTDHFTDSILDRRRAIRGEFSKNFSRLVDASGLTQAAIADKVTKLWEERGVRKDEEAEGTRKLASWELSRWARGQQTPDPAGVEVIAEVLGVRPDELVTGVAAEANQSAMRLNMKELADGRVHVEFAGVVDQGMRSKILALLAQIGEK